MEKGDKQAIRVDPGQNDAWGDAEAVRRRRLREDARRPLATNLAEGLALTEYLSKFTGSAKRS